MNPSIATNASTSQTPLITNKPKEAVIGEAVKASIVVGVLVLFFVIFFLWLYCSRYRFGSKPKSDEETLLSEEMHLSE